MPCRGILAASDLLCNVACSIAVESLPYWQDHAAERVCSLTLRQAVALQHVHTCAPVSMYGGDQVTVHDVGR